MNAYYFSNFLSSELVTTRDLFSCIGFINQDARLRPCRTGVTNTGTPPLSLRKKNEQPRADDENSGPGSSQGGRNLKPLQLMRAETRYCVEPSRFVHWGYKYGSGCKAY
ncbi:hypothetical protein C8J57DRAFT_1227489 [Mycena rebaudengoi]|nr:hypothetical protein C8J57DRAFT_1227489 [Mycena rebaudengoi]